MTGLERIIRRKSDRHRTNQGRNDGNVVTYNAATTRNPAIAMALLLLQHCWCYALRCCCCACCGVVVTALLLQRYCCNVLRHCCYNVIVATLLLWHCCYNVTVATHCGTTTAVMALRHYCCRGAARAVTLLLLVPRGCYYNAARAAMLLQRWCCGTAAAMVLQRCCYNALLVLRRCG
ncbi:unnamed protein product [Sphagnum jensenii]|uniref:Uncharacterized protein n=1 Tax=Sphagnum jensenii TaxID=128206 RepID=A0ABP0XB03_9BRYO